MNPSADSSHPLKGRLLMLVGSIAAAVVLGACGGGDEEDTGDATQAASTAEQRLDPQAEQGRNLFVDNCGTCHTLDAAGTEGSVGPNLDEAQPDEAEVLEKIANGGGSMPAGLVTGADAEAVAKFVADSAAGS